VVEYVLLHVSNDRIHDHSRFRCFDAFLHRFIMVYVLTRFFFMNGLERYGIEFLSVQTL